MHDVARERLDDGSGAIRPELAPLVEVLATRLKGTPETRLQWLKKPRVIELLAALGTGKLPLDHAALDAYPVQRQVAYLRGLLVTAGCLPDVDPVLHDYENWLANRLTHLADHPHERVLRQFGRWHQLAKMRSKAKLGPLRPTAGTYAVNGFNRAVHFCDWLISHQHELGHLSQSALDRYYRDLTPGYQHGLRPFLHWAIAGGHMPRLTYSRPRFQIGEAMSQDERLDLLRRMVLDDAAPLAPRVATCIMLLYGLPLTRVRALTLDDISRNELGEVALRLGNPAVPVPGPFAALLLQLTAQRTKTGDDRWLFSGRQPGQPVHYQGFLRQVRNLGLPPRTARASGLRELVLQVPASVAAEALGLHHTTTQRQNRHAGGVWNRYTAARQPR